MVSFQTVVALKSVWWCYTCIWAISICIFDVFLKYQCFLWDRGKFNTILLMDLAIGFRYLYNCFHFQWTYAFAFVFYFVYFYSCSSLNSSGLRWNYWRYRSVSYHIYGIIIITIIIRFLTLLLNLITVLFRVWLYLDAHNVVRIFTNFFNMAV